MLRHASRAYACCSCRTLGVAFNTVPTPTLQESQPHLTEVRMINPRATCFMLLFASAVAVAAPDNESSQSTPRPGWTQPELAAFTAGCVVAILAPAKTSYAARAVERGNSNPKPFPEKELVESLEPMCKCLSGRVSETWSLEEMQRLGPSSYQPLIEEAMSGGRCKPGGLLGQVMQRPRS